MSMATHRRNSDDIPGTSFMESVVMNGRMIIACCLLYASIHAFSWLGGHTERR
jgi:hypothetical protein